MLLLFAFFTVNRFCHMYLFPFPENILPESLPTNFHLLQVHFRHTEKNQVHDLFLCTGNELYSLFSVWKNSTMEVPFPMQTFLPPEFCHQPEDSAHSLQNPVLLFLILLAAAAPKYMYC